jgi:hypothetical protein
LKNQEIVTFGGVLFGSDAGDGTIFNGPMVGPTRPIRQVLPVKESFESRFRALCEGEPGKGYHNPDKSSPFKHLEIHIVGKGETLAGRHSFSNHNVKGLNIRQFTQLRHSRLLLAPGR